MPRFLRRLLAPATGRPHRGNPSSSSRHKLNLSRLEDRTNPVGLNFIPFSTVAVNPDSLPSTALLQFNPLPDLSGIPAAGASIVRPIQISGVFQQTLTPPSVTGATTSALSLRLNVTYNLHGTMTVSATPSSTANGPGSFSATFNLSGVVNGALYVPEISNASGAASTSVWAINTSLSEQGTVSGALNPISASPVAGEPMSFNLQVTESQIETRAANAAAAGVMPWKIQSTIGSSGDFLLGTATPAAASTLVLASTPFSLQNQINETLSTVAPVATQPEGGIRISATDDASGTASTNLYPPSLTALPPVRPGSTQYHEQLTEAISFLPGPTPPTQPFTESFDTTGVFSNIGVVPLVPLVPSPTAASAD